jgi:hypothetical protein
MGGVQMVVGPRIVHAITTFRDIEHDGKQHPKLYVFVMYRLTKLAFTDVSFSFAVARACRHCGFADTKAIRVC